MHAFEQYKNHNHYSIDSYSDRCDRSELVFFAFRTRMESLLCNEVWLMSPDRDRDCDIATCFEESSTTLSTLLDKETRYLPEPGYRNLVESHDNIRDARFKAVTWIIKSQRRMDLFPETVFAAVNYLDRFISLSQCQEWKYSWMFELLSIACLSIATKFNETTAYQLHEFQDDLDNSFSPNLIQRMEVTVLKGLDWRVDSTTPFSYIHLLTQTYKTLVHQLTQCVTQLLLDSLLDPKFLEFKQCVVAISAIRTVFRDYASFAHLDTLIPLDHKDDLIRCQGLMEKLVVGDGVFLECGNCCSSPSSPVTVLLKVEMFNCYDLPRSSRKRKIMEQVDEGL